RNAEGLHGGDVLTRVPHRCRRRKGCQVHEKNRRGRAAGRQIQVALAHVSNVRISSLEPTRPSGTNTGRLVYKIGTLLRGGDAFTFDTTTGSSVARPRARGVQ